MKLLLDENLPKKLKRDLSSDYEVTTVRDNGWQSKKNGELLRLMIEEKFQVFITFDKSLQHQQNFKKYPIKILLLKAKSNSYPNVHPLIPKIKKELRKSISPGVVIIAL